jgi:tetratricopeptide (TPR) repeat protein
MSESGRWARPSDPPRSARTPLPADGKSVHDAPTARIQTGSGDTPTRAFPRGWASGVIDADDAVDETRADLRITAGLPHDQVLEAERRMEADDRDGAARALAGAITRAPRWARPRVLLARLFLRQGEVDFAVRQLEAAAEVEPLDPRAHYLLGKVRADQKDAARAEESFRRALYLEPDFVVARWGLARVYEQAGRADRACKELRTILRALRSLQGRLSSDALDGFAPDELRVKCESAIASLGGRIDESSEDARRLV